MIVTLVGGLASLIAAVLWFLASTVRIPAFPDVGFDSGSEVFEPVRKALIAASRLNAAAAFFSAIAAICFGWITLFPPLVQRGRGAGLDVPRCRDRAG
jgi:hypothetical protein